MEAENELKMSWGSGDLALPEYVYMCVNSLARVSFVVWARIWSS